MQGSVQLDDITGMPAIDTPSQCRRPDGAIERVHSAVVAWHDESARQHNVTAGEVAFRDSSA